MKEYNFTPDEKALYLGCARMGLAGAGDDEVLSYVKNVKRMNPSEKESTTAKDYESVLADHRRLVRKLDILLNGDGAAEQASLCDIVSQVEREGIKSIQHVECKRPQNY